MEQQTLAKGHPVSPSRSDKSNESEGGQVREKLKETRIDAQASSDLPPNSDQAMNDVPTNGTAGDHSASGSDSERGRLRRKRSRENFEADHEEAKQPEKKQERHVRKKSREVTGVHGSNSVVAHKPEHTVPSISEKDGDETSHLGAGPDKVEANTTDREGTPEKGALETDTATIASPKNKRTREQAEAGAQVIADPVTLTKESTTNSKPEDERTIKRPRDGVDAEDVPAKGVETKIPTAFANTSSASPFGALSPKPQAPKSAEVSAEAQPQTSDTAFKSSGFGAFSSSNASPFSATNSTGKSPFAASSGNKLSPFAPSTTAPSSFAGLGNSSGQSTFGGGSLGAKSSGFGVGLKPSSGFGAIGGGSKLTSFGSGAGITGLTKKPDVPFGSKEQPQESDEDGSEEGDEGQENEGGNENTEAARRSSQILLQSQGPPGTGEENEDTIWTGRAKLYTLAGEGAAKAWQERGVGPFKFNVTQDDPPKARFVLRADGTHRLLLNAAITRNIKFGDANGNEPKEGRLLFTAPTASGNVESHQLKLKPDRAVDLWQTVVQLKPSL